MAKQPKKNNLRSKSAKIFETEILFFEKASSTLFKPRTFASQALLLPLDQAYRRSKKFEFNLNQDAKRIMGFLYWTISPSEVI